MGTNPASWRFIGGVRGGGRAVGLDPTGWHFFGGEAGPPVWGLAFSRVGEGPVPSGFHSIGGRDLAPAD